MFRKFEKGLFRRTFRKDAAEQISRNVALIGVAVTTAGKSDVRASSFSRNVNFSTPAEVKNIRSKKGVVSPA